MTDVTTSHDEGGAELSSADERLLRELTERARTGGLKLTGEGGLLGRLTKMVVEGALEGELDDHLGYGKHDPADRNDSNPAMATGPRRCSPIRARWKSPCRAIVIQVIAADQPQQVTEQGPRQPFRRRFTAVIADDPRQGAQVPSAGCHRASHQAVLPRSRPGANANERPPRSSGVPSSDHYAGA